MAKTTDPNERPAKITFVANPEIWRIVLEERMRRPLESTSEIIRDFILAGNETIQASRAQATDIVTEIESITL
jgi:hypothetical protein